MLFLESEFAFFLSFLSSFLLTRQHRVSEANAHGRETESFLWGGASETAGIEAEIGLHPKDILLVLFVSSRSEVFIFSTSAYRREKKKITNLNSLI